MKLQKIDIKKEEKILNKVFADCLEKVKSEVFYETFANEKIKHSMQVVGAGNYILKNDKLFQNKDLEYMKLGKLVNLFHDIGRFKEIELLYQDPQSVHNHSYYSYEKLKELGYSDLRLLLPIKQHGHLEDALEKDEEYRKIQDENLKCEIEELFFLVRDADKIANLYLIKHNKRVFEDLFFAELSEDAKYAPASPRVMAAFEKRINVPNCDRYSFTDRLLQIICFGFEIHYKPSYDYISQHGLFDNIIEIMRQYNPDKQLQKYVEDSFNCFIEKRYNCL